LPQDDDTAARCRHLAADEGKNVEAQHNLAQCYARGAGVLHDFVKALHYNRLAAAQGSAFAQCNIAQAYLHAEGVSQDFGEGARYHRLAADQGYAPSMLALGARLLDNQDVPVNERTLEPALAGVRAGAKLLARAAQSEGAESARHRLQALELLRSHADKREVVSVCCIGCGATEGLKQCTRCHVARFSGSACMRLSWRAHKECCARWAEEE